MTRASVNRVSRLYGLMYTTDKTEGFYVRRTIILRVKREKID